MKPCFFFFQVATADGNAAHLVDMYEDEKDGYSAYQELVRWYEDDELTPEIAEDTHDGWKTGIFLGINDSAGDAMTYYIETK